MAKGALARSRRVEGIGEGSVVGTLSRLLQLTCEAVVVFDGAGRILLVNDEAAEVFGRQAPLAGTDVRALFSTDVGVVSAPPAAPEPVAPAPAPDDPAGAPAPDPGAPSDLRGFSPADLPFATDGSAAVVPAVGAGGRPLSLRVRCEGVQSPGETYLLVAMPVDPAALADRELDRSFSDLVRKNKRLSGALSIVLDTLDSEDVATLFNRVLDEIAETMEADGTVCYLAESDGLHLRGISSGLAGERLCRFMAFDRGVERLIFREGRSVRLRVLAPSGGDLRQGRLGAREVVNEDSHEVVRIDARLLPPFTSFIAVPVWFGGAMISIIEVGWRRLHPTLKEDAQLLDSVGHYLSVQLAGAFSSLRSQRAERLQSLATDLRERLLDTDLSDVNDRDAVAKLVAYFDEAADELEATPVAIRPSAIAGQVMVDLPLNGMRPLALDVDALSRDARSETGVAVVPVLPAGELSRTLRDLGEPCVGALIDLGELRGDRRSGLLLRPDGAEPFDELELDFLERLAEDVRQIALGDEAREQDKRISQALQSGMRNELQTVEGISAQGVYSSATATAFVGGDFYDLIRLPDRRACVIMGDVSGKGVEAASVSAAVKTALGAYAWEGLAPARMVRTLNEFLLGFSRVETFATLFVGIIDLAASKITYCSAGHPPAILMGRGARKISILDVQSGVVGAFHDIAYTNGTARLHEGDVLLLYTDGTTEARSPDGSFFGEEGLRDMVMRESEGEKPFEGFVDRLLATLDAFTGRNLEDDVALLALRFDELGRHK